MNLAMLSASGVAPMMTESTDVLIAGARCAGAPLGLSLARAGRDVLLVDAAHLPCYQPMSTHFIQPFGIRILGDRAYRVVPLASGSRSK